MWGYRVLIPEGFRKQVLEELHSTHQGMVKMKSLARQYFWWPNLDKEIERVVRDCDGCMSQSNQPVKAKLIKFEQTQKVFERIHLDFAGPFQGKYFLILIDAFSKWIEVAEMTRIDSCSTIEKLREWFARFGLPDLIFTDNGTSFTSEEFFGFCNNNGIRFQTSPPYHFATNGAAENAVKSFKKGLLKALADVQNKGTSMQTLLSRFWCN